MNGRVDGSLRALVDVVVRGTTVEAPRAITSWIDTAFNGFLVFPRDLIVELGLPQEAATEAILADGTRVTLESFICYVEWFGKLLPAKVNDG